MQWRFDSSSSVGGVVVPSPYTFGGRQSAESWFAWLHTFLLSDGVLGTRMTLWAHVVESGHWIFQVFGSWRGDEHPQSNQVISDPNMKTNVGRSKMVRIKVSDLDFI